MQKKMRPERHERGCAPDVEEMVLLVEQLVVVAGLWTQTRGTLIPVTVGIIDAAAIAIIDILTLNIIDFV